MHIRAGRIIHFFIFVGMFSKNDCHIFHIHRTLCIGSQFYRSTAFLRNFCIPMEHKCSRVAHEYVTFTYQFAEYRTIYVRSECLTTRWFNSVYSRIHILHERIRVTFGFLYILSKVNSFSLNEFEKLLQASLHAEACFSRIKEERKTF